jgi:hypothetical protein
MKTKKEERDNDRSFLTIRKDELDREWILQAKTFDKWARRAARAQRNVDQAKADLDVCHAEQAKDIREIPDKYSIEKITDKVVEDTIILQHEYQRALKALNDAKYEKNIVDSVVESLQQKKYALQNLVTLHGQDYFSTPRAKESDRELIDEMKKKRARMKPRREE